MDRRATVTLYVDDFLSPQVLTCPDHDQEKLQFYCRSCQRLLCPLCKLRRIHTGHKILPVVHAYQALKVYVLRILFCVTPQNHQSFQFGSLRGLKETKV